MKEISLSPISLGFLIFAVFTMALIVGYAVGNIDIASQLRECINENNLKVSEQISNMNNATSMMENYKTDWSIYGLE